MNMNLKERNANMRDFFNKKIDSYDMVHNNFMNIKSKITDYLKEDTKKVLDLGAGTGLELIPFFERFPNAKVVAIDITENMLRELKKRSFADNVTTICGDFFEVDFGGGYDAVISTSALHHFLKEDKIKLYEKVYNCLGDNGQFINVDKFALTEKEECDLLNEFYDNKNNKPHLDTPLAISTEKQILEEVGFVDVLFEEVDKDSYKLMHAVKRR